MFLRGDQQISPMAERPTVEVGGVLEEFKFWVKTGNHSLSDFVQI
jgi:hypothetical protein